MKERMNKSEKVYEWHFYSFIFFNSVYRKFQSLGTEEEPVTKDSQLSRETLYKLKELNVSISHHEEKSKNPVSICLVFENSDGPLNLDLNCILSAGWKNIYFVDFNRYNVFFFTFKPLLQLTLYVKKIRNILCDGNIEE